MQRGRDAREPPRAEESLGALIPVLQDKTEASVNPKFCVSGWGLLLKTDKTLCCGLVFLAPLTGNRGWCQVRVRTSRSGTLCCVLCKILDVADIMSDHLEVVGPIATLLRMQL